MYLVLVPMANHRVPASRAWSNGMASKGAVITQCLPTYYYAFHEASPFVRVPLGGRLPGSLLLACAPWTCLTPGPLAGAREAAAVTAACVLHAPG